MNNTVRWLWRVTGKKKGYILALTLLQAAQGGSGVLYALCLRGIVDCASGHDSAGFWRWVLYIAAVVLAQLVLSAAIRWLNELATSTIENTFKQRLTDGILHKRFAVVSATHTAEWLNRMTNDTVVVAQNEVEILPRLAGTLVRLISALVMIVVIDRWFARILIPGGAAMIVLAYIFRNRIKRMHKRIQENDGQLRVFLQERIGSLMIIKSFGGEAQVSKSAAEKMAEHKAARMKRNRVSNLANSCLGVAMQGMYLIGVVYCANGILTGRISYGTLTAVMQLIAQVRSPLIGVSGFIPRWYAMIASAERLMEIEKYADDGEIADLETMRTYYSEKLLRFGLRHASFAYPAVPERERQDVLRDVSIELRKGEYAAFTGPSGHGKSTVLKLLMCMYPLKSGDAFVDDAPLTAYHRRLFAYVPQGNALMNGTIREALGFAAPEYAGDDVRLSHALEIACASEFVAELEHGVDTLLGERGAGFSEGQLQRLSIARAIFSGSPILLLDEATSALDEATEKRLLENLRRLTDRTVIIVTHRKAALSICDRVFRFSEHGLEEERTMA